MQSTYFEVELDEGPEGRPELRLYVVDVLVRVVVLVRDHLWGEGGGRGAVVSTCMRARGRVPRHDITPG